MTCRLLRSETRDNYRMCGCMWLWGVAVCGCAGAGEVYGVGHLKPHPAEVTVGNSRIFDSWVKQLAPTATAGENRRNRH